VKVVSSTLLIIMLITLSLISRSTCNIVTSLNAFMTMMLYTNHSPCDSLQKEITANFYRILGYRPYGTKIDLIGLLMSSVRRLMRFGPLERKAMVPLAPVIAL